MPFLVGLIIQSVIKLQIILTSYIMAAIPLNVYVTKPILCLSISILVRIKETCVCLR